MIVLTLIQRSDMRVMIHKNSAEFQKVAYLVLCLEPPCKNIGFKLHLKKQKTTEVKLNLSSVKGLQMFGADVRKWEPAF